LFRGQINQSNDPDVTQRNWGAWAENEAVFIFAEDTVLTGKSELTIVVAGLGTFRPNMNPVPAAAQYATMFPANKQMSQWCYARKVQGV
jgi:hypothetical protein